MKDPYSIQDCSYIARDRDNEDSLDEERVALSMTVDEVSIMERWGQAAKITG